MNRRRFMKGASSVLAGTALAGCTTRMFGVARPTTPGHAMDAAAFHDARRFVRTKFGKIAYVERGSGDVALFLHGFPLNGFQWRALSIACRSIVAASHLTFWQWATPRLLRCKASRLTPKSP